MEGGVRNRGKSWYYYYGAGEFGGDRRKIKKKDERIKVLKTKKIQHKVLNL